MPPRKPVSPNKRKRYNEKEVHIFFKNLQRARLKAGFGQDQMAEKLGMANSAWSRLEAGVFPNDPARVVAIAKVLNCSLDWLFGMTEGVDG